MASPRATHLSFLFFFCFFAFGLAAGFKRALAATWTGGLRCQAEDQNKLVQLPQPILWVEMRSIFQSGIEMLKHGKCLLPFFAMVGSQLKCWKMFVASFSMVGSQLVSHWKPSVGFGCEGWCIINLLDQLFEDSFIRGCVLDSTLQICIQLLEFACICHQLLG